MTKREERENPDSCWNKAREDEGLFVIMDRDAAAPDTIRDWVARRLGLGLNVITDAKIREALDRADSMEKARSQA